MGGINTEPSSESNLRLDITEIISFDKSTLELTLRGSSSRAEERKAEKVDISHRSTTFLGQRLP